VTGAPGADGEAVAPIETPRLTLVSMSPAFLKALLLDDIEAASRDIGAATPQWMADELRNFATYRLGQLMADPTIQEWLGRAMVLTDELDSRVVVGSIGFHGPPDEEGRLEVGYSVDPPYRRRGYARESVEAMFDWAYRTHGITTFIASISPDNEPSLRLAAQFGFVRVGEHMDEIDGLEYVFETTWPPTPA
jgi:ribosomal-protein-alanine N-acetyltransferase